MRVFPLLLVLLIGSLLFLYLSPLFDAVLVLGFDHGVGHSLLLLYDAKTPRGQKIKEFNGLGDDPFNASIRLF